MLSKLVWYLILSAGFISGAKVPNINNQVHSPSPIFPDTGKMPFEISNIEDNQPEEKNWVNQQDILVKEKLAKHRKNNLLRANHQNELKPRNPAAREILNAQDEQKHSAHQPEGSELIAGGDPFMVLRQWVNESLSFDPQNPSELRKKNAPIIALIDTIDRYYHANNNRRLLNDENITIAEELKDCLAARDCSIDYAEELVEGLRPFLAQALNSANDPYYLGFLGNMLYGGCPFGQVVGISSPDQREYTVIFGDFSAIAGFYGNNFFDQTRETCFGYIDLDVGYLVDSLRVRSDHESVRFLESDATAKLYHYNEINPGSSDNDAIIYYGWSSYPTAIAGYDSTKTWHQIDTPASSPYLYFEIDLDAETPYGVSDISLYESVFRLSNSAPIPSMPSRVGVFMVMGTVYMMKLVF